MKTVERILEVISQRGISKNQLLEKCGLSKNSFVNWEKRGSEPGGEAIKVIAEYLGVTSDYLLGVDIKQTEPPATDNQLKFALFGTTDIDDELLDDVKKLAKMQQQLKKQKGK